MELFYLIGSSSLAQYVEWARKTEVSSLVLSVPQHSDDKVLWRLVDHAYVQALLMEKSMTTDLKNSSFIVAFHVAYVRPNVRPNPSALSEHPELTFAQRSITV
jgi:hypothetical protein